MCCFLLPSLSLMDTLINQGLPPKTKGPCPSGAFQAEWDELEVCPHGAMFPSMRSELRKRSVLWWFDWTLQVIASLKRRHLLMGGVCGDDNTCGVNSKLSVEAMHEDTFSTSRLLSWLHVLPVIKLFSWFLHEKLLNFKHRLVKCVLLPDVTVNQQTDILKAFFST